MLNELELRHFKCFSHLKLPINGLTLLSGRNSSGKSSVLHALALLHQTFRDHEHSTRLLLNGTAVDLGTVSDVINEEHGRRTIGISLRDAVGEFQWEFEGNRLEMSMEVRRAASSLGRDIATTSDDLRYLLPLSHNTALNEDSVQKRLRDMFYLSAERLGPRDTYPLVDPWHVPVVGSRGEHAVAILYNDVDEEVLEGLAIPEAPPIRLRQAEAHMKRFFPGCELAVDRVARSNAVTLALRTSNDTGFHRTVHIGFGLTQVLPIIVAALFAKRNGILMIENPEVHLHPSGQAEMGEFLAEVAIAGVQVIMETHSDHVLNGVRRAVKKGKLSCDDVSVHFFRPRSETLNGLPQVQTMAIDSDGGVDSWPDGFFDQFDKDINYFAGWN